jgi:eukaryotic translation initiation factor 2-alpha kinase 4
MYSLGIIFFEMCYPLGTGMERVTVLRAIREKDHILPKVFQSPEHALQGDIIMSLLHHKPSERPSSNDLLQSGKLPLQVEDEIFRKALLGISDSDSPQYQKILSAMFSQPAKKVQESAWDRQASSPQSPGDILLYSMVKDRLTSLFRRHGAMETKRQLLFPRSEQYSGNVVRLLDPNGTVLQLPYDFTVPNARSIVRGELLSDKSFFYGTVYRELPQGGEPARHGEVDFDIVSPDTSDLALKEAEVIKVLDEITLEFPPLKSAQMCFHLNHSDLLELIMDFCHVDLPQRPVVEEIISTLNVGHWTWQKIRNKLRSPLISIPSTSLDDLARFDFRGRSI